MTRTRSIIAMLVIGLVASSCGTGESGDESRLDVVATTTILGDVIENIGGDDVAVEVLTPVGADPHDFEASASQVARINEADLVVANGLGLEEGLEDVLDAASEDGVRVFEVGPLLDPIPFGFEAGHEHEETHHEDEEGAEHEDEGIEHEDEGIEHEDEGTEHEDEGTEHEDEGIEHEHGEFDPHFWFDPMRMAESARLIAGQLDDVDPEVNWMSRAEDYAGELLAADEEIAAALSSIPEQRRLLVTNHESLGYFADRYDFEVVGVVIPGGSTLGAPSSSELAELVDVIDHEGVRVIFGETTQPVELAEAVASELGEEVQVVTLFTGSLGEPGSGADTLIGMLETNADRIAEALS